MSVTFYSSADAGAPVINGSAGSFINWLDTIPVGIGTAYGSKPKKGWTKLHTGTNKAVYRTVDGVGHYRVVHDGSQGAASTREVVVRGAEGASGVDTLVDTFPLVTQRDDATCVWRLSNTADTVARPWEALVGPNFLVLMVQWNTTAADVYRLGAYDPAFANAFNHCLSVRAFANASGEALAMRIGATTPGSAFNSSLFVMRSAGGSVKSVPAFLLDAFIGGSGALSGASGSTLQNLPDINGRIVRAPARIFANGQQSTTSLGCIEVGAFPNVWLPQHGGYAGAARLDEFQDSGYDPAARFRLTGAISQANGREAWEITDTWQSPYG